MKEGDKFSEWYRQRFNSMVEQPPDEVWNNISKELDIKEVWNKVDSRLNKIDRRKDFKRRTSYVSFLFFLLFISGAVVFKTYKNAENRPIIEANENNRFVSHVILPGNQANLEEKEFVKSPDYYTGANVPKASYENSLVKHFSQTGKNVSAKQRVKKTIIPASQANTADPTIILSKNTGYKKKAEDFLTVSIPTLLVSAPARDSLIPYFNFTSFAFSGDSNFYPHTPGNNSFHGFYSGGIASLNNMWLLNQFTIDGLKANTLNQTKIGFGCAYGISAGYNFNTRYGGELSWYINSPQGQTYNLYDEGSYVTKRIRMDISVVSLALKCRKEGYYTWLKTPKSRNLLIGLNLGIFKRDRSSLQLDDNDDDIDIYEIMDTHYKHVSYGIIIGYEYEILAFHKIILSSALIGNYGLNNIFAGNGFIPESFNRTHAASLGFNLAAKYMIK